MKTFASLIYGLTVLQTFAAGASIPRVFERAIYTRSKLSSNQVQRELGSQLSNTTVIFGPDDSRFGEATGRWNGYAVPKVRVVVEPGQESDVSAIVTYCNENGIEFMAYNRGHGNPTSVGDFKGLQINMANLREISIQSSGQSAWFQGGVYAFLASDYLWDQGYVTTTGSCDCVGLVGAGLGGGHGRLEGYYGMVSDNIIQLNVVLANGSAIRVNSTSHSDLLWGMRGAGHNFGIVTSFEMGIYPRGPETWYYKNYIWTGDKLEDVFTALNNLHGNGSTPVAMAINAGNIQMNATISEEEPVIAWKFGYRGSAEDAQPYFAPFDAIETAWDESGDVAYPELAHVQGVGLEDPACMHGFRIISATAGLQVYNISTERLIYEGFKRRVASVPSLAAAAAVLHEGPSTEAVDQKDPSDSAYPFRDDHHLLWFTAIVDPVDKSMDDAAWEWAEEVKDQFNAGQPGRPVDVYVNYANGLEPVEDVYGHEEWRLEKLRALKAAYDSENKFRYFVPIV